MCPMGDSSFFITNGIVCEIAINDYYKKRDTVRVAEDVVDYDEAHNFDVKAYPLHLRCLHECMGVEELEMTRYYHIVKDDDCNYYCTAVMEVVAAHCHIDYCYSCCNYIEVVVQVEPLASHCRH